MDEDLPQTNRNACPPVVSKAIGGMLRAAETATEFSFGVYPEEIQLIICGRPIIGCSDHPAQMTTCLSCHRAVESDAFDDGKPCPHCGATLKLHC